MRKTWIKVKRGLLEPKHVSRLGPRYPYYLHLLDIADWEEGAVLFYRDQDSADDLGIPISTIRKQRRKLEEDGYIVCIQSKDHQKIIINNWTNPREYSGEVYNESDQKYPPLKSEDIVKGDHKGDHKGNATMDTPSSNSQFTDHKADDIKNDPAYFMLQQQEKSKKNPESQYPPAVRDIIKGFYDLWTIRPPKKGERDFSGWIRMAKDYKAACGDQDWGKVMENIFIDWDKQGRQWAILNPGALVNMARKVVSELEQKKVKNSKENIITAPDGFGKSEE